MIRNSWRAIRNESGTDPAHSEREVDVLLDAGERLRKLSS